MAYIYLYKYTINQFSNINFHIYLVLDILNRKVHNIMNLIENGIVHRSNFAKQS